MLTPQEIRFLSSIKDHELVQNVSFLLNALVAGTELHSSQIDQVIDHCNDVRSEHAAEGTPLPNFIEVLWELFTRLSMGGGKTPDILAQQNPQDPYFQPPTPQQVEKKKKPKDPTQVKPPKPRESIVSKYANTEINPENIPAYLLEISQIIDKIVAAKCADVVKENADLKAQLAKIQALIGGK